MNKPKIAISPEYCPFVVLMGIHEGTAFRRAMMLDSPEILQKTKPDDPKWLEQLAKDYKEYMKHIIKDQSVTIEILYTTQRLDFANVQDFWLNRGGFYNVKIGEDPVGCKSNVKSREEPVGSKPISTLGKATVEDSKAFDLAYIDEIVKISTSKILKQLEEMKKQMEQMKKQQDEMEKQMEEMKKQQDERESKEDEIKKQMEQMKKQQDERGRERR